MNDKTKTLFVVPKSLIPILFSIILLSPMPFLQESDAVVQTITIDLSGQPNTNTFPYGICYDGTQYVWVLIFASGQLARIDKGTSSVTIFDNDSGTSGFDWYSCAYKDGKIYITEKDTGRMRIYTVSTNSWTTIALPADISGGVVSYTEGYNASPHKITINGGGCNNNQQEFGFDSYGEVQNTNGFIWVVMKYNYDFSQTNNDCGATDTSFVGIIKINPSTNAIVSRTAISGATAPRGIDIDPSDSTVLWITDFSADKIFKFDTDTLTVDQTITLPASSKARGITCTVTDCYVALNKASGGNSKILKVVKADGTTSEIDTGASNTSSGTFEVDITSTNFLMWSDQSGHVGSIDLNNLDLKTVTTTTNINSNHFGVEVDGNWWWAGQGSAKVTVVDITRSATDPNGGDEFTEFLKSPTFGVSHDDRKTPLVDYGFEWNGKQYKILDNQYTPFDKVQVNVGTFNTAKLKIFSYYNLDMVELALVPDIGKRHEAESAITVYFDYNMKPIDVQVRQNDKIIDGTYLVVSTKKVECTSDEENKVVLREGETLCHEITIQNIKFNEKPFFEKISLMAVDEHRRVTTTYLNEGFDIVGKSLNPSKTAMIGLEEMTQIDKFENLWTNKKGDLYTTNDYGSWILLYKVQTPQVCNDHKFQVLERYNCNFSDVVKQEQEKAIAHLKKIYPNLFDIPFDKINNIFAYDIPISAYFDCEGNIVSQKSLDCMIMKNMKLEEAKAMKKISQQVSE